MVDRQQIPRVLAVTAFFTFLYAFTRAQVFSYDGIIDAVAIESGPVSALFHPNHLLYPSIAALIYQAVLWCGAQVRALFVMQLANSVTAGVAVGLFFAILERHLDQRRAILGALALGVSQAFWMEAVDPGGYAWASLATCVLLGALLDERVSPFKLGLIHGATLVAHQLLIFVIPAVLIKRGWRSSKAYLSGLVLMAGGSYLLIALLFHGHSVQEAIHWVLSPPGLPPGGSIQFLYWWTFDLGTNCVAVWSGFVHSMIASPVGSLHVMLEYSLLGLGVVWMIYQSVQYFKTHEFTADSLAAIWVWIGIVNVFLFFYVPGALRFRLLFMPALIYLILALIGRMENLRRYGFWVLTLLLIGVLNYVSHIGPQSKLENSPNLKRALWVSRHLQPNDVFLFAGTSPESITNVYVLYFAPAVRGRSFQGYFFNHPGGDLNDLKNMVLEARRTHRQVYMEGTLFTPDTQHVLEETGRLAPGTLKKWLSKVGKRRDWREMDATYGIYRIS